MHRLEWPDDDSVEFALRYGDWFRLLRSAGFEVEDLLELQAPEDATRDLPFVDDGVGPALAVRARLQGGPPRLTPPSRDSMPPSLRPTPPSRE